MEKIVIKPVAKEILLKGGAKDGPSDLFSYDYDADHAKRSLGNLYVVGNIQAGEAASSDDLDVGYVINLVASLAKREYYADASLDPKEAFTAALKKINGVIEEFFKHKDTKINIGIFTIAGNQIHISKLGKFKILLARDGDNIDILNNVDLFKKESTQERQFSNIISGAVAEGDRLLAFYPSRVMIAREKQIKASLLDLKQSDFAKKIEEIKDTKQDFACAAVHVELKKTTEAAVVPHVQPKELEVEPEPAIVHEPVAKLATAKVEDDELEDEVEEKGEEKVEEKPAAPAKPAVRVVKHIPAMDEMPKIIPAEFALGRKASPFAKYTRQFKNMNFNPKNKAMMMGSAAAVVVIAVVLLKSFVFVSASTKAITSAITQASTDFKTAQTKISQNELADAHSLLVNTLATLSESMQSNGGSTKADTLKGDIVKALDELENAVDVSPTSVAVIPAESGTGQLLATSDNDVYVYVDRSGTGAIVKVSADSVSGGVEVKDIAPTALFGSNNYISAVDLAAKKVSSLSLQKNNVGSITLSDELVSTDVYQGNLYGITSSSIIKITDAASGHKDVKQWLTNGTLAADPRLIAVDGNIFVLSANGVLTTYYKGEKKDEHNTSIAVGTDSILRTSTDSPYLYLVNKTMGRIYMINKSSGMLEKTMKLNTQSPILSAAVDAAGTVYILSDNTVWKVQ